MPSASSYIAGSCCAVSPCESASGADKARREFHRAAVRDLDTVFSRLNASPFRRRFRLGEKERAYLTARGLPTVLEHARDLISKRLAPAEPVNDGRQTP